MLIPSPVIIPSSYFYKLPFRYDKKKLACFHSKRCQWVIGAAGWGCARILPIKGVPLKHYKKLSVNKQYAAWHQHHPHEVPGEQLFWEAFLPSSSSVCLLISLNSAGFSITFICHFCCHRSSAALEQWGDLLHPDGHGALCSLERPAKCLRIKIHTSPLIPSMFHSPLHFCLALFFPPPATWLSRSQTGPDRSGRAQDATLCRSRTAADSHYQLHLFEDYFFFKGRRCRGLAGSHF